MRRLVPMLCAAALAACARPDQQAVDSAAGRNAPKPLALADVAGRWRMQAMNTNGDSLTSYELAARPDTSGWTLTFRNRPPLPVRVVAISGDSVVTEVGPYPRVLQKNASVRSIRAVNRLHGDSVVGTFRAVYDTKGPDSVLYGRHVGRRSP